MNNIFYKIEDLKKTLLKFDNVKLGLCHGVFDVLHYGHINHIIEAKKKSDILVVSITADKFVNKGIPFNNENNRAFLLSSIKYIDYVLVNYDFDSAKIIKKIKPKFYFKGMDYLNYDSANNLRKEKKSIHSVGGKLIITKTKVFSSTKIINNLYRDWNSEQKIYFKKIAKKYSLQYILEKIDNLSELTVNIVGDPIVDRYIENKLANITNKDPAISVIKTSEEDYDGGSLFIAKLLSRFVKKVNLITYGNSPLFRKTNKDYKNIKIYNFNKFKTIQIKTRFISYPKKIKLLQVSNFRENYLTKVEENKILSFIKKNNKNLIVCDFGVGMFNKKIINLINLNRRNVYLNVQNNSLNYGFNLFTKYKWPFYLSLDLIEWQLGFKLNNEDSLQEIIRIAKKNTKLFSLTLGQKGSILVKNNTLSKSPSFTNVPLDTTGCGDAYFAFTSVLLMQNNNGAVAAFLGNAIAAMHSLTIGNSKIIEKKELKNYIKSIINF